ncbi:MAG TPA: hypothetical protein VFC46_08985, partial [Humisphaera sp.]|nr:hypothetical protein [Humisphaera sp.]
RAAEGMVKLALQRAKRLMVQDRLSWPPRDHAVHKALTGQRLTSEEYADLDDYSVMHCLKLWTRSDDVPLAALCRGLMDRTLFKTIDLSQLSESDGAAAFVRAQNAVVAAGGDGTYDLFYDDPYDESYETFAAQKPSSDLSSERPGEILIRDVAGKLTPLTTLSPLPQAMNRQLMFRRIHVSAPWRDLCERAAR